MAIPAAGFAILQGEPVIGGMRDPAVRHYFCAHCMSWMFTRPQGLEFLVNLRATMLDDPSWVTPFIETYTSEQLPWASTPASHRFERFPAPELFTGLMEEYAAKAPRPAAR